MIALHPLGLESSGFAAFGRVLARRGLRTIAVDLPGFGRSPAPAQALTPGGARRAGDRAGAPPAGAAGRARPLARRPRGARSGAARPDAVRGVIAIAPALPWLRFRALLAPVRLLDPRARRLAAARARLAAAALAGADARGDALPARRRASPRPARASSTTSPARRRAPASCRRRARWRSSRRTGGAGSGPACRTVGAGAVRLGTARPPHLDQLRAPRRASPARRRRSCCCRAWRTGSTGRITAASPRRWRTWSRSCDAARGAAPRAPPTRSSRCTSAPRRSRIRGCVVERGRPRGAAVHRRGA